MLWFWQAAEAIEIMSNAFVRYKKSISLLLMIVLIMSFQGCSRDSRLLNPHHVKIDTNPQGAMVTTDDSKKKCITPCKLTLSVDDEYIFLEKDNFNSEKIKLQSYYSTKEHLGGITIAILGVALFAAASYVYIGDLAGNIVQYGGIGGLAAENRHAMTLKKDVNVTLDRR
ncbi:MAG: hypothetical protein QG567_2002 [Campylobacterota bacterium]|nr:hypothetical protein [Campylobacterota bacterium]